MTNGPRYHSMYIPLPDVCSAGGDEIFKHFEREKEGEKNAVVFSHSAISHLDSLQKETLGGTEYVLNYIKEIVSYSDRIKIDTEIEKRKFSVFEISQGLDLVVLDNSGNMNDDLRIDSTYKNLERTFQIDDKKPKIVTHDPASHIRYRSRSEGMIVEDPKFLMVSSDIVNEGIISGNDALMSELCSNNGAVPADKAAQILERKSLYLNQFIKFKGAKEGAEHYRYASVSGKMEKKGGRIVNVVWPQVTLLPEKEHSKKIRVGQYFRDKVFGISPRDMDQYLAMQYGLFNPDVELFFICGSQGSGKTLLSYVSAIDQILFYDQDERIKRNDGEDNGKESSFEKIVLLKPTEVLGGRRREVGFLPGTLYEKVKPHLMPYIDAHKCSSLGSTIGFEELLKHPAYQTDFGEPRRKDIKIGNAHLNPRMEAIEITYSGYMRGRSFENMIILVDEAQNFTPYEMKTIIERMGEGCKCIIMGDPDQFDNPLCSREINGLTAAIKRYIDKPYSALIKLAHNYRSQMSNDSRDWKVFSQ